VAHFQMTWILSHLNVHSNCHRLSVFS